MRLLSQQSRSSIAGVPAARSCDVIARAPLRGHLGCSAQLQKDAPASAPRDDMAARALEFFGLSASRQAGNNAVPMRPGTGASPSLQAMRERAREAAEAALAEQSAPQHAAEGVDRLRRRLDSIERELRAADDAARAAGLDASSMVALQEAPAWLTAPPRPAPPVLMPPRLAGGAEELRAEGTGQEILLQGFNWESCKQQWWEHMAGQADFIASCGFTVVWLPPPTDSVSREGYMPRDLYNLNSSYGGEDALKRCVSALQAAGLKVLCDAVLNHRCAHSQDKNGVWNQFGGRLAWDATAIVSDDAHFRGKGNRSTGDSFGAAPNIDHSQEFVRRDLAEWLQWLRAHAGYDGWRFDFVRGFTGEAVREYLEAASSQFTVGEYWDSLNYNGGVPDHNQDAHRQRTVNWLKAAGGLATAFDVTTKGILHAVFERNEYWRLKDAEGKPPGLVGWWPSRSVLFLENHDTGSTQGHWRFPNHGIEQGYVYIMTHPGTPCVFWDHLQSDSQRDVIQRLIAIRRRAGVHCRSAVQILKAEADVYAAQIDDSLLMRIGGGRFKAPSGWSAVDSGDGWVVYTRA